jgi:hypothetical protein
MYMFLYLHVKIRAKKKRNIFHGLYLFFANKARSQTGCSHASHR